MEIYGRFFSEMQTSDEGNVYSLGSQVILLPLNCEVKPVIF